MLQYNLLDMYLNISILCLFRPTLWLLQKTLTSYLWLNAELGWFWSRGIYRHKEEDEMYWWGPCLPWQSAWSETHVRHTGQPAVCQDFPTVLCNTSVLFTSLYYICLLQLLLQFKILDLTKSYILSKIKPVFSQLNVGWWPLTTKQCVVGTSWDVSGVC